jgi:hypothetical protein
MRALLWPLALAIAACRPAAVPSTSASATSDPCVIGPRTVTPGDSVVIAADGIVLPDYALRPTTPADYLVRAQAYETLVRVTCDGRIVPGLAEQWTGDSTGRVWMLSIRPGTTFSGGELVTADAVVAAWNDGLLELQRRQNPVPTLGGVTILDDRRLAVHFLSPQIGGPRLLADPRFAVHLRVPDRILPTGTGPYEVSGFSALPIVIVPRAGHPGPVLVVPVTPSGDSRNLIDGGVDVLLTWDRRVVDYAATRPELAMRRLPPDRAYVLLTPARADPAASPGAEDPRWGSLRMSLARDIVRGSASAADPWWATNALVARCALETPPAAIASSLPSTRARRLVYPAGDRLAGELAERVVALIAHDRATSTEGAVLREMLGEQSAVTDRPIVVAGLNDDAVNRSLIRGADAAYLVAVERRPLDACAAARSLGLRAPWLTIGALALLAEAGPTLITGPRAPALTVDWDNTLRVVARPESVRDPR